MCVMFFVLYYDCDKVHDFLKSITQVILVYKLLENIGKTHM